MAMDDPRRSRDSARVATDHRPSRLDRDRPPRVAALDAPERPREKAWGSGIAALSDAELLALLLRTGGRDGGVLALAARLLGRHDGVVGLAGCDLAALAAEPGIGPA